MSVYRKTGKMQPRLWLRALGLIYCVLLMEEVGCVASSKVQILGREFVITFQVEILH